MKASVPTNGIPTPDPKPDNCKTETGEVCFYKTDVSVSDQATTTSKAQSTCLTVFGCDATESSTATTTTATATGRALNYAVYPSNGADKDQVTAIASALRDIVANPDTVKETTAKYNGVLFWTLPLNESAAKKVDAMQDVSLRSGQANQSRANKCILGGIHVAAMRESLCRRRPDPMLRSVLRSLDCSGVR